MGQKIAKIFLLLALLTFFSPSSPIKMAGDIERNSMCAQRLNQCSERCNAIVNTPDQIQCKNVCCEDYQGCWKGL